MRLQKMEYDLCIIGGGAAGLVTAAGAAALGAKVILIEQHRLGGDCLYTGCVPSKALIHAAGVAHTVNTAQQFGLSARLDPVNQSAAMQRIADVIKTIEPNDSPERFRAMGVEVVFAEAQFIDQDCLLLEDRQITARKFVLATGSRPFIPPISGLAGVDYLTNETIFNVTENISHLIVIGSGAIGCEMAQSFARLGTKVSLLSNTAILPREDADMSAVVEHQFINDGIDLHLNSSVDSIEKSEFGVSVYLDDATVINGSHILVATGRSANIDKLGLDKAGVKTVKGRLVIDKRLRPLIKRSLPVVMWPGLISSPIWQSIKRGLYLETPYFICPLKHKIKIFHGALLPHLNLPAWVYQN